MRNIPVLVMQSMPVMAGTAEVLVSVADVAPEVVSVAGTAPEALVEGVGTTEMLGVWLMPVLELSAVVVSVAGMAEVVLVVGAAPEMLMEGVGTAEMLGVVTIFPFLLT